MDNAAVRAKLQAHMPLLSGVFHLHTEPKYSDLRITCNGQTFQVHRAIVCLQCDVIARMCDGNFREAREGVIDLPDDDPTVIAQMISYLYTTEYADEPQGATSEAVIFNVDMHTIADKYNIHQLGELAAAKFKVRATAGWSTPGFASAIQQVYGLNVKDDLRLRKIILEIAVEHSEALCTPPCGAAFVNIMETVPRFAAELFKRCALGFTDERRYTCVRCVKSFTMKKAVAHMQYGCPNCVHQFHWDTRDSALRFRERPVSER